MTHWRATDEAPATAMDERSANHDGGKLNWWGVAATVAMFLVLAWANLGLLEFAEDDAYIHLRIARNLVEHGEPHFNLDEPIKGSSSTAWLLVATGFSSVSHDPVVFLAVLNAALVVFAAWLAARLQARLVPDSSLLSRFAVGMVLVALLWPTSRGLMESVLACVFLLSGYLLLSGGSRWAWLLLGMAIATRVELVVAVAPVIWYWSRSRSRSLSDWSQAAGLGLAGILPFFVFDLAAYRTLVPHAAIAKRVIYEITAGMSIDLMVPLLGILGTLFYFAGAIAIAVTPQRIERSKPTLANATIVGGLLVATVYAATRTLVFPWYQPLILAPLFLGSVWKGWLIHPRLGRWAGVVMGLPIVAYGLVVALALSGQIQSPLASHQARTQAYLEVGEALDGACASCTLASSEIGGLGYSFQGEVLDAGGLTDPDALAYHPMAVPEQRPGPGLGSIPIEYIREKQPDLIVSYEALLERGMLDELHGYVILECPPLLEAHLSRGFPPRVLSSDHLYVFMADSLEESQRSEIEARLDAVIPCQELDGL